MRLFKGKDKSEDQRRAIGDFWAWWAAAREDVATEIESGNAGVVPAFAASISGRVNAIHKDLEWESTPGVTGSRHALVVTSAGKPELRAVAARWLAAAPPADATWEYHEVRRADPSVFDSELQIGQVRLKVDEIRYGFTADEDNGQVDVVCHHPAFADLPDEVQAQVTFLSLDWLLGEDRVETWIGEIHWSSAALAKPREPVELRDAVLALAAGGEDRWALLGGEDQRGVPRMAVVNRPLRGARWPRFDTHLAVSLPYQSFNDGRLPVDASLQALRDFGDALEARMGADGRLVAHETGDRVRTLHLYVDSQSDARQRVESAAPDWREGKAEVAATYDPGLNRVRHLG
jgi:hypothetical protein